MNDNRHLVMVAQTVTKAQDFAKGLDDGYRRLLKGIKPNAGEISCHQLVGNALYVDGGKVEKIARVREKLSQLVAQQECELMGVEHLSPDDQRAADTRLEIACDVKTLIRRSR